MTTVYRLWVEIRYFICLRWQETLDLSSNEWLLEKWVLKLAAANNSCLPFPVHCAPSEYNYSSRGLSVRVNTFR